jgi:hypothetical protein
MIDIEEMKRQIAWTQHNLKCLESKISELLLEENLHGMLVGTLDLAERLAEDERKDLKERTGILGRIASTHETRIAALEETIQQARTGTSPTEFPFDVFGGKLYGSKVQGLIEKAWHAINSPSLTNEIVEKWLTPEQQSILPYEFEVMACTYLINTGSVKLATLANLEARIRWMKKTEIGNVAKALRIRGYLRGRLVDKREHPGPGVRPFVDELTERGMALFLGSSKSASTGGATHMAMELEIFRQAISQSPPQLYMSVMQVFGETRCDGVKRDKMNSKTFSFDVKAVQIETEGSVRSHSSIEPNKEGQVFLNLIAPFAFGAKRLEVVCLEESEPKLLELRAALPSWMSNLIDITKVNLG